MKVIIFGLIVWLIYDTYKDLKIEKELQATKQRLTADPIEKGDAE